MAFDHHDRLGVYNETVDLKARNETITFGNHPVEGSVFVKLISCFWLCKLQDGVCNKSCI